MAWNNIKQFIFLLVLIFASTFTAVSQKDAKARVLLEQSEKAFKNSGAMSAYFTINIKDAGSKDTHSFDGTIFIKGEKFKIDAPDYDIYFDGKTQWVYNEQSNEVNIIEPEENDVQTLNPSMIYEIYKKNCDYKLSGEKTDNKMRKVKEIILTPKSKKQDLLELTVQLNEKDSMPVFIHAKFKNNKLENVIYINKYEINQNLSDSVFVFDETKFSDVEIIDLR
jgi:outer membrane lipoprotein-sorting protein